MKKKEMIVVLLLLFGISQIFAADCGDVNNDGVADIIDALLVSQFYVGLDPQPFDQSVGDVNEDSSIDIIDGLLIAQFYVGLIPELDCGETITPTPIPAPTPTIDPNAPIGPAGYIYCADEGDSVTFDVEVNVAYGADGSFNYLYGVSGTITFDNDTFGDPIHGTVKHGFYQETGPPTPTPTPTQSPIPTDVPTTTPIGTTPLPHGEKPRVIVTSDGEIDDQCSMVRFLLYSNEFDVEGIVKTSSQYHSQGHNWAGDYWERPIFDAYETLYPNLILHDPGYPTRAYLDSITKLGNVSSEGDMSSPTEGSNLIANVLMDESDDRPVWLQAWGGPNSIARALKTIKDDHPEKMEYVASKCRFFFIWEQDNTFKSYIRDNWATPYNIPTIISDQFITFGYWWQRWNMPDPPDSYLREPWMKANIFNDMDNNPLIKYYNERTKDKLGGDEDFIGEGDSPSFIHEIPTGLRNLESPDWGGWGGRYVLVRENTWLDKVPVDGYKYPSGRWYTSTGWGRQNYDSADQDLLEEYFKPITRWIGAIQCDFAARVDWCVESYANANHQPVVLLGHPEDLNASPGQTVQLSAQGTSDPDGDQLTYKWWQYHEADSVGAQVSISNSSSQTGASFTVPNESGKQVHIICEVKDNGTPVLTRYRRVVININ